MSQLLIPGGLMTVPFFGYTSVLTISQGQTINATGETVHMCGQVMLENPNGGSKTISAAGGGKIIWRSGTTTFADAGTTVDIGLQDLSTASSPAQGDGTFDVSASFTGGGGGITANAFQTSTMTSGSKTLAQGDPIAITLAMTARAGSDSVVVAFAGNSNNQIVGAALFPCVTDNTSGSYTRLSGAVPNAVIVFDDGTIGWLIGTALQSSSLGQTYNVNTATADEYGNLVNLPCGFNAIGIGGGGSLLNNSSDCELLLYSTPLGTPTVERTITVDATQISAVNSVYNFAYLFSSPFLLKPNTDYAITQRPTTANNATIYYKDTLDSVTGRSGPPNSNCYAVRRLNNTGAFYDYNGGTAKTRMMSLWLIGSYLGQDTRFASYKLGI